MVFDLAQIYYGGTPIGTAESAQVLTGYTFSNDNGTGYSGSMPNRGNVSYSNSQRVETIVFTSGYVEKVTINYIPAYDAGAASARLGNALQNQVLTGRLFTNENGSYFGTMQNWANVSLSNNINGVDSQQYDGYVNYINIDYGWAYQTGEEAARIGNAVQAYVLSGYTFTNVSGSYTGTMVNYGNVSITNSRPAWYNVRYNGRVDYINVDFNNAYQNGYSYGLIAARSGNAASAQVLYGYTFTNASGSYTGAMTNYGNLSLTNNVNSWSNIRYAGYVDYININYANAYQTGQASARVGTVSQQNVLTGYTFTNALGTYSGTMNKFSDYRYSPGATLHIISRSSYTNGTGATISLGYATNFLSVYSGHVGFTSSASHEIMILASRLGNATANKVAKGYTFTSGNSSLAQVGTMEEADFIMDLYTRNGYNGNGITGTSHVPEFVVLNVPAASNIYYDSNASAESQAKGKLVVGYNTNQEVSSSVLDSFTIPTRSFKLTGPVYKGKSSGQSFNSYITTRNTAAVSGAVLFGTNTAGYNAGAISDSLDWMIIPSEFFYMNVHLNFGRIDMGGTNVHANWIFEEPINGSRYSFGDGSYNATACAGMFCEDGYNTFWGSGISAFELTGNRLNPDSVVLPYGLEGFTFAHLAGISNKSNNYFSNVWAPCQYPNGVYRTTEEFNPKYIQIPNTISMLKLTFYNCKDYLALYDHTNSDPNYWVNGLTIPSFYLMSMFGMFCNCQNLFYTNENYCSKINFIEVSTSHSYVVNAAYAFSNCINLTEDVFEGLDKLVFSNVCQMFNYDVLLKEINMNTYYSNNFSKMFSAGHNLVNVRLVMPNNGGNINTASMFDGCVNLSDSGLMSANIHNTSCLLNNSQYMFYNCRALTTIYINHFSSAGARANMFWNCINLRSVYINNLPYISAGSSLYQNMFALCNNLRDVYINSQTRDTYYSLQNYLPRAFRNNNSVRLNIHVPTTSMLETITGGSSSLSGNYSLVTNGPTMTFTLASGTPTTKYNTLYNIYVIVDSWTWPY